MNHYKVNRINEWILVADRDAETVEILLTHQLQVYDIVCFHCQ